ncbi:SAM-dependent methyltransferase [Candidatus Methanophagaceae archaeon]|nr:SAM-dependent methyltransferase [Methanophagales archaeon]
MKFEEYINKLRTERAEAYIDLSKDKEQAYMESHKHHFAKIFNAIPDSPNPIKILDIGTTPFTLFIKETYPHYEVATIDLTDLLKTRCKQNGVELRVCDLTNQPIPFEDDYFDVVIFTEVFEHLFAPPTDIMRKIGRVLRGGGLLIFSTPNFATLLNRVKLLVGISPMASANDQMKRGWVHGYGHIREYTMKEILSIIESSNFAITKKKISSPTPSIRAIKSAYQLAMQIYHLICLIVPAFRSIIYIECYKLTSKDSLPAKDAVTGYRK